MRAGSAGGVIAAAVVAVALMPGSAAGHLCSEEPAYIGSTTTCGVAAGSAYARCSYGDTTDPFYVQTQAAGCAAGNGDRSVSVRCAVVNDPNSRDEGIRAGCS